MTEGGAPRVARVVTRLNVGGPARQVVDLTRSFGRPPGAAILLAGSVGMGEGDWTPLAAGLGDSFTLVPGLGGGASPAGLLRAYRAIRRAIASFRPDVVHTHESRAGLLGRLAARRERVPVVVHTHHGHVLRRYFGPIRSSAITALERRLARLADALVVPAPEIADEMAALGVAPRAKFVVVQPGLDVSRHLAAPPDRDAAARARLGLDPSALVVAFAGRLVPVKDPLLFVEVARRVAAERPDARFVVAGDGPLRARVEAAARRAAPGRFAFTGFLGDAGELFAAADLVVATSRHEGLPAALVEAMARGAAVVATRVGGIPGLVEDGATGLLAPSGDADALAAAALLALRDEPRRRALGEAARAAIRSRGFSPERMARELAALYARLLAERTRG